MSKKSISGKSLQNINKKKKNILLFSFIGIGVLTFLFAILNGIDVDHAMQIEAERNKILHNPNAGDLNTSEAETKISWAINMENTIQDMKQDQERIVEDMTKKTRKEIVKANGILLNEIKQQNTVMKGQLDAMRDANTGLKKQLASLQNKTSSNIDALSKKFSEQRNKIKSYIEDNVMMPPPPLEQQENKDGGMFQKIKDITGIGAKKQQVVEKKAPKNKNFEVLSYKNEFPDVNETNNTVVLSKEEIKKRNTYEIVTGFTDAYLITGAYAPLFADGQGGSSSSSGTTQSVPVLMETNGDLLMPNNTIGSIDKCFLLGVTNGNAGARSVEIRLDKMTCLVDGGKKTLQGKIEGYVVSESGTPGLPATLIYKAGDFISRMIGAGILESLSSALVNGAGSLNTVSTGGLNLQTSALNGAGTGMSNAFTKLSDFYLQLAEATLPILEVKPGRFVSVVLVGGNKFELKDINLLDTRDVDTYLDDFIGE